VSNCVLSIRAHRLGTWLWVLLVWMPTVLVLWMMEKRISSAPYNTSRALLAVDSIRANFLFSGNSLVRRVVHDEASNHVVTFWREISIRGANFRMSSVSTFVIVVSHILLHH
jgi:hypothetical protein